MQIFARLPTGKSITLDVEDSDSIIEVMHQIMTKTRIPTKYQRLNFGGNDLNRSRDVEDYGIKENDTIDVLMRLRGGMEKFEPPPAAFRVSTLGVAGGGSSGGSRVILNVVPRIRPFQIVLESNLVKTEDLKRLIKKKTGIDIKTQIVRRANSRIMESRDFYSWQDGETITVSSVENQETAPPPKVKSAGSEKKPDAIHDDTEAEDNDENDEEEDDDSFSEKEEDEGEMQIFVKLPTGKTITLAVDSSDTINIVKAMIAGKTGIPRKVQRLTFGDDESENELTLQECDITEGTTLTLLLSLVGGGKRGATAISTMTKEDLMLITKSKALAKAEVVRLMPGVCVGVVEKVEEIVSARPPLTGQILRFINELKLEEITALKTALDELTYSHSDRVAVLLTTHMMPDWVKLCERTKVMESAKTALLFAVEYIYTDEFYREPKNMFDFNGLMKAATDRPLARPRLECRSSRSLNVDSKIFEWGVKYL